MPRSPPFDASTDDPAGFDRRLVAPGRRAGLDVDAGARGPRRRQPVRATACSTWSWWPRRWARLVAPGPAGAGQRRGRRPGRVAAPPSSAAAVLPGLRRRRQSSPPGAWPSRAGRWTGHGRRPRPMAMASCSAASAAVEAGGPGRPAAGDGPDRPGAHPVPRARPTPPGVTRRAAGRPRPRPALRRGRASTASRCRLAAVVGPVERRRPPTSSGSCRSRSCCSAPRPVGAADRVFEFTLEYAFDRYSFGRPLASYQALKHRFADMKLWLEACHGTATAAAADAVARPAPPTRPSW